MATKRVSNEQVLQAILDLTKVIASQQHQQAITEKGLEAVQAAPPKAGKAEDKYLKHQLGKMAEYAAKNRDRYYLFTRVNKAGQTKLYFRSEANCVKYGLDLGDAIYVTDGKNTHAC